MNPERFPERVLGPLLGRELVVVGDFQPCFAIVEFCLDSLLDNGLSIRL
jgi:hypothetical protein